MSGFYDDMRGIASDLLKEFGQGTIEYVATEPGGGSPDDPGASVETVYPVNGTARGVSFKYIDGANVVASDLQITLPGDVTFTPDKTDFVKIDGTRFKIVQIVPKPAAGMPVAYTIIIRR